MKRLAFCLSNRILIAVKFVGTIIGKIALSETSLIITWSTEEFGVVKTVARSARKPKSQFAGKLDLFYFADVEAFPSKKSDLHTLKEIQVIDFRRGLLETYWQTLGASYFAKLIHRIAEPETPIPELNDLLNRALDYLCVTEVNERAVLHFEKQAVEILGLLDHESRQQPLYLIQDQIGSIPKIRSELMTKLQK